MEATMSSNPILHITDKGLEANQNLNTFVHEAWEPGELVVLDIAIEDKRISLERNAPADSYRLSLGYGCYSEPMTDAEAIQQIKEYLGI